MLIHVVPYLPPSISGVGDYAFELARTLRNGHSLDSAFVVCDLSYREKKLDGFLVESILQHTPGALFDACNHLARAQKSRASAVLIHYVGYGYHSRGAPLWFAQAVRRLKRDVGEHAVPSRVLTVFHELFAMGRLWESSFWLSPMQRLLAKDIARMSDGIMTNRAASARWLGRARGRMQPCPLHWLPVFSNVGEPAELTAVTERPRTAVIWGSAETRQRIYRTQVALLGEFVRAQGIKELHDIGATASVFPDFGKHIRTIAHGLLPPDQIGKILRGARFGFFDYNLDYLTKSGIYAAYCAYGLVPVHITASEQSSKINNQPMLPLTIAARRAIGDAELIELSKSTREWYLPHSKQEHAKVIRALLQEPAA